MDKSKTRLEDHLLATARTFAYPPTPDIASQIAPRKSLPRPRLVWTIGLASLALVALLFVPGIRSEVSQWLNISPAPREVSTTSTTPEMTGTEATYTATLYGTSALQATPAPPVTAAFSVSPAPPPAPPSPGD